MVKFRLKQDSIVDSIIMSKQGALTKASRSIVQGQVRRKPDTQSYGHTETKRQTGGDAGAQSPEPSITFLLFGGSPAPVAPDGGRAANASSNLKHH